VMLRRLAKFGGSHEGLTLLMLLAAGGRCESDEVVAALGDFGR
jgi:hypothetical protein